MNTAIKKYNDAAELAPNASEPLRNPSAAFFEIGKYKLCISHAERALGLLPASNDDTPVRKQKLDARIAKAKAHSNQLSST
jgi:tetratricopeptide (TPR) repeat protein